MFYLLHLTEEMSEESKQRRKAEHEDLLTVSIFVLEVCPVWTEFCDNFFLNTSPANVLFTSGHAKFLNSLYVNEVKSKLH